MDMIRQSIINTLNETAAANRLLVSRLTDRVLLTDYTQSVRFENSLEIWSDALQAAITEHEIVVIPPRSTPYYIDRPIIIGSNRRIEAEGASVILTPGCDLLMFRNASAMDGTHAPIPEDAPQDSNISICGGYWAESRTERGGYGSSGKIDAERSFFGVSTLFFFNHMKNLTIEHAVFAHTAGFAVQIGDMENALFEDIRFEECYADGLHINGNTAKLICRDIRGQVGDDLVALNAYDWQNSSVDFGPIRTVLCENLELSADSRYKAIRIEPGCYRFDDGSEVDCSISDTIFKDVRGIKTFKLYFQTPPYSIGGTPERGSVGSIGNLYFEDITLNLDAPIDKFPSYMNSDPVRGIFGAFEFGANAGTITFRNVDLKLDTERFPLGCLAAIGPKSVVSNGKEVFDPYVSCKAERLVLNEIRINGIPADGTEPCIYREVRFDDINHDGHSTGSGSFEEVLLNGRPIR